MRAFYLAYREAQAIVPQAVGQLPEGRVPPILAQIPWGHNVLLIEKLKDPPSPSWKPNSKPSRNPHEKRIRPGTNRPGAPDIP